MRPRENRHIKFISTVVCEGGYGTCAVKESSGVWLWELQGTSTESAIDTSSQNQDESAAPLRAIAVIGRMQYYQ